MRLKIVVGYLQFFVCSSLFLFSFTTQKIEDHVVQSRCSAVVLKHTIPGSQHEKSVNIDTLCELNRRRLHTHIFLIPSIDRVGVISSIKVLFSPYSFSFLGTVLHCLTFSLSYSSLSSPNTTIPYERMCILRYDVDLK